MKRDALVERYIELPHFDKIDSFDYNKKLHTGWWGQILGSAKSCTICDDYNLNNILEFEDLFHLKHRYTYWTCGWRTEQSSALHRDFRWWSDNSYMGYTDWCDAGLLKSKQGGAPGFPDSCRPDALAHGCVHLNTSYIESYGWWDAGVCGSKKVIVCEHLKGNKAHIYMNNTNKTINKDDELNGTVWPS